MRGKRIAAIAVVVAMMLTLLGAVPVSAKAKKKTVYVVTKVVKQVEGKKLTTKYSYTKKGLVSKRAYSGTNQGMDWDFDTTWTYNKKNKITKIDGMGGLEYDKAGRVKRTSDNVACTYNKKGRLTKYEKAFQGSDLVSTYQYDSKGRPKQAKLVETEYEDEDEDTGEVSSADTTGVITWQYDKKGQVKKYKEVVTRSYLADDPHVKSITFNNKYNKKKLLISQTGGSGDGKET